MSHPAPIRIRDACPQDAAAIAAMANALAEVTNGRPGPMTAAKVEAEMLAAPGLGLLVAERGAMVLGYALWTLAYETAHGASGLYLSDLYVLPSHRRHGHARALIAELARRARDRGASFLWWVVVPGNTPAQRFYDSLGAISDPVTARAVFDAPFEALIGPPRG